jgi:UDP-glucose 4-epimerase
MEKRKKTIMVTGASGFIGKNFIEKYEKEYNIISVSLKNNEPKDLDYTGVDAILHLAALVHQMEGAPKEKYYEVNTELTSKLATKAKKSGVRHFIFYSTVAVYGTHGSLKEKLTLTLNSPTVPKDDYGKSKLLAEEYLKEIETEDFKVTIIRPPMVYGKNCPGNMKKLEKLIKIFPILPFNYEENKRSIVHVDKLLEMTNDKIKNEERGIFIPKDEKDKTIKEIVESFGRKRILIKFPQIIFRKLAKIKPRLMESLFGDLRFK